PCDGTISRDGYGEIVETVRAALSMDARSAVLGIQVRLRRLISQQRFEEAEIIRRRLETLTRTAARFHRIRSLAACPEIVAARRVDLNWEIHVVRYGRLGGAGRASGARSGPSRLGFA